MTITNNLYSAYVPEKQILLCTKYVVSGFITNFRLDADYTTGTNN